MPRQHAAPILIQSLQGPFQLQRLVRLRPSTKPDERRFPESLLQELIHSHPDMLPVEELEPSFRQLRPVCRELPLGRVESKYLDNLLINPDGRICLVECKLWRNPEAVRAVVAQTLDYASELSRLTYEDLNDAVRRTCRPKVGDVVADNVLGPDVSDEVRADFHDAVTRSLQLGNFLLLIVGDGIKAGLQQIAELLQNRATLGFSLALIEMAIYGSDADGGPYYVQPRLLLQTEVITRTVFIVGREDEAAQIADVSKESKPQTLTEQEFYENLKEQDPTYPEAVRSLLEHCKAAGVEPELRRTFVLYVELADGDRINVGTIRKNGTVEMWGIAGKDDKLGEPIGRRYMEQIVGFLAPDASLAPDGRNVSYKGKASIPLKTMLNHQDAWLAAIGRAVERFHASDRDEETGANE